jgi:SEC-C motif
VEIVTMKAGAIKRGRNDVCPCGSGQKYKRCCLATGYTVLRENPSIPQTAIQNSMHRMKSQLQDMDERFVMHEGELKIKMSEVILHLADNLLKIAKHYSEYKNIIGIVCIAWNLSIAKNDEKQEMLERFLNKVDEQAKQDTRDILLALIEKKNLLYPHMNRFILSYDLLGNKQNFHLNVISTVSQEEVAELGTS